jgi:hypothetical protein
MQSPRGASNQCLGAGFAKGRARRRWLQPPRPGQHHIRLYCGASAHNHQEAGNANASISLQAITFLNLSGCRLGVTNGSLLG